MAFDVGDQVSVRYNKNYVCAEKFASYPLDKGTTGMITEVIFNIIYGNSYLVLIDKDLGNGRFNYHFMIEEGDLESAQLSLFEEDKKATQPIGCQHEWVDYHGLMESYKYCKKCNQKGA